MQNEIMNPGLLLNSLGTPNQVGWSRQPLLDCNLESARFYLFRPFQKYRIKRWDYYAVFSPNRFFSATIADLGYAGNIFVYTMDFITGDLHEESLIIPFARGVQLARNSTDGNSSFMNKQARVAFSLKAGERHLLISWPNFHEGRGINADITLSCPDTFESMNIVIPIGEKRFYYNRKLNCMPASGIVKYGEIVDTLDPKTSLGSLDWGRGVWEYKSFWNWASASGYLPDGRTIGLNLGCGFGDLTQAGENAIILENRIHKLEMVAFEYDSGEYLKPWIFHDTEHRLNLIFTPFKDRTASTNLGIITSEVHQLIGVYNGEIVTDNGNVIKINKLIGFAEEHHAKW
jgi:Domain of unknown function (DUF2804), N-terminal/Domain of unknown function (DUF2804), C-terminal